MRSRPPSAVVGAHEYASSSDFPSVEVSPSWWNGNVLTQTMSAGQPPPVVPAPPAVPLAAELPALALPSVEPEAPALSPVEPEAPALPPVEPEAPAAPADEPSLLFAVVVLVFSPSVPAPLVSPVPVDDP